MLNKYFRDLVTKHQKWGREFRLEDDIKNLTKYLAKLKSEGFLVQHSEIGEELETLLEKVSYPTHKCGSLPEI